MPIKTFRSSILSETVDQVPLHTNNGSIGYRIKKLEIIPKEPGTDNSEMIVKIYSIPQTTATNVIDFSDQTLLGCAYRKEGQTATSPASEGIIFDNITFNQDIYVTYIDGSTETEGNYYIELEQVRLDLNQNTVATLKDIRNIEG